MLVGLAVFSHWILDLIVHRPDLAVYDDTLKVGFGLWNYKGPELVLEIAILVVGIAFYFKRNVIKSVRQKLGIITFGLVMILIQAGNTFGGRRPVSSGRAVAVTALVAYTVFAGMAFLLGKRRA
jgi:hypothetical protein